MPRAPHGHEGRPTRLAPAPRALGARAMSDDEQTQLEAHAPVEGGAQLSHGPGTAAETGPAALAGAAEAVTDPPATLRARMIADLANFVPAGTNVEAVADVLLYHNFANMHEVMEVELTASDLIDLFPFDLDLVVALRVGLAVAVVVRGVTLLGMAMGSGHSGPMVRFRSQKAPAPCCQGHSRRACGVSQRGEGSGGWDATALWGCTANTQVVWQKRLNDHFSLSSFFCMPTALLHCAACSKGRPRDA